MPEKTTAFLNIIKLHHGCSKPKASEATNKERNQLQQKSANAPLVCLVTEIMLSVISWQCINITLLTKLY